MTPSKEQTPDILKRLSDIVINLQEGVIKGEDWDFLHVELYGILEISLKRDTEIASFRSFLEENGDMLACRAWALTQLNYFLES